MRPRPLISLVLPARNEEANVARLHAAVCAAMRAADADLEFLFVEDGSTDRTADALAALARRDERVRPLYLARGFGKEGAILAGLDHARGDAAVVMDCDLQHPPALLPEMVRLWREERCHVVNGRKRARAAEPWLARWSALAFYRLFGRLAGLPLQGAADFKLLDRRVVDVYRRLPERNLFFRGLVPLLGFRQTELPFAVEPRVGGRSQWPALRRLRLAVDAITAFSAAPLQIVTAAGLLFLLFAALLSAQTLYYWAGGRAVEGFTTVILVVLIASSVLMLSLGIIGQYLARMYEEVKQRPRYLLRDAAGDRAQTRRPAEAPRSELLPIP